MEEITKEMSRIATKIDNILDSFFLLNIVPSENLLAAMRYSTIGGGKKIRPFLLYKVAKKLNVNEDIALYIGACIEILHSYTLIHDDLPCMDDDDIRRNKSSTHIKFNEFTAVLTGDALQSEAFYLLSSENLKLDAQIKLKVINFIAEIIGGRNLISGQMLDLEFTTNKLQASIDTIQQIHRFKTAKLIVLCTALPSIIAKKDRDYHVKLTLYGEKLGLIYQIVDDFQDKDSLESINIINVLGKDEAKNQLKELDSSCRALLRDLDLEDLNDINDYIIKGIL